MRAFSDLLRRFRRDNSGNIAVIFTLAALPLISAVGCAVDYSRANALRSKLQAAADAATVGSVSKTAPGFIAAGSMTGDGTIPSGVTDATNLFTGNMSGTTGYTLNSATPTMNKVGSVITSQIQFSANISTMFMNVIGKSAMTVTGSSTATANMPLYVDFYLLLDNSPSMGVGATPADVATMVANTPDKCAFACHDLNNSNNYYDKAKSLGVTTRIDVLRTATQPDGYRSLDADLFEPVPDGDLRFWRVGKHDHFEGAVFAVVEPDQRQDRRGQYRPHDGPGSEPEPGPGHPIHQHLPFDEQRDQFTGRRQLLRAAEIPVLRIRWRRR